jgi:hypothetical protein
MLSLPGHSFHSLLLVRKIGAKNARPTITHGPFAAPQINEITLTTPPLLMPG